ncbi:MAG: hypothetical protein FWC96_01680 [Oscillospiraceae bacterium]|nr:hypothetical protein [Oscillospiraceae bacterium]
MKRTIAIILLLVAVIGLIGLAGCASTYRARSSTPVRDNANDGGARHVPHPRPHAGTYHRRQPRANVPADNETARDGVRGNLPQTGVGGAHEGNRAGHHAGLRGGAEMPNMPGIAFNTNSPLKPPTQPAPAVPQKPAETRRSVSPAPAPAPAPNENAQNRNRPAS